MSWDILVTGKSDKLKSMDQFTGYKGGGEGIFRRVEEVLSRGDGDHLMVQPQSQAGTSRLVDVTCV